jgi:threonine dehydrogenase-like Zn-dependent dehydrogenase
MAEGTVLGHEAVGVVEATGADVRGFTPGDRVVVCSTIGCGHCSYCRAGYYAQCDVANPNGPDAGTSFFGGPQSVGPVDGQASQFDAEQRKAAPDAAPRGGRWVPGDAPSLAARWAVEAAAKAGSIGVIGVYSPEFDVYPIGQAMNKNLTVKMGNCNHRRYVPRLLDLVAAGLVDPAAFITQEEKPTTAIEAYETFDRREEGWGKTVLDVS